MSNAIIAKPIHLNNTQSRPQAGAQRATPQDAPPSYEDAVGAHDAFNAPRYTPSRQRQLSPTSTQATPSRPVITRRTSSSSERSSAASSLMQEMPSQAVGQAAVKALETLKTSWTPTPGIHYFDGAVPITSGGGIAYQPYVENPKQTRGEAVQQRKLEVFWLKEMGRSAPFPANARAILKDEVSYDAGYGGAEKVPTGKLSTFGKMAQKLTGKGKAKTFEQDVATVKERFVKTPGIAYFTGGPKRESAGKIEFEPYKEDPKQTKSQAIRQRKLEAIWLKEMPGEPFPGNARAILQEETTYNTGHLGAPRIKLP